MMAVGLVFDSRELHVYVSNLQLVHRTFFRDMCNPRGSTVSTRSYFFFKSLDVLHTTFSHIRCAFCEFVLVKLWILKI